MPTRDIRWVAGIIEGEGTMYLDSGRPRLMVRSTDKDVLAEVARLVGTGNISGPYRDTRIDYERKMYYSWQINGKVALQLMKRVRPYMLTRRQGQIDNVVENMNDGYRPRQT